MDPRTWSSKTDYLDLQFEPSLQAYTAQRRELMVILDTLPLESWARSATITGAGKPLIKTVHSFAARLAIHERSHLKQLERAAKALRTEA